MSDPFLIDAISLIVAAGIAGAFIAWLLKDGD